MVEGVIPERFASSLAVMLRSLQRFSIRFTTAFFTSDIVQQFLFLCNVTKFIFWNDGLTEKIFKILQYGFIALKRALCNKCGFNGKNAY